MVVKRERVFRDLQACALYIGQDNPDAAERFLDAAETAFKTIGKTPFIGRLRSFSDKRLRGLRSWRMPDFGNY